MAGVRPDTVATAAKVTNEGAETAGCAVLAVPHSGLGEGLRSLLGTLFDSVVLVADERSLVACLGGLRPALLLLDVALSPGRAFTLTARARNADRTLRILLLVGDESPALREAARDAGADGCLLKGALGTDLIRAVETVLAGGSAFWSAGVPDGPQEPMDSGPAARGGKASR